MIPHAQPHQKQGRNPFQVAMGNSRSEPSLLQQYQEYRRSQQQQQQKLQSHAQLQTQALQTQQEQQEQHPLKRKITPQVKADLQTTTTAPTSVSSTISTSSGSSNGSSGSVPKAQLTETAKHLQLSLDLPGVNAHDISVTVQHGVLLIKGCRNIYNSQDQQDQQEQQQVTKRYRFCRRFAVDTDVVDLENMKANLNRGVLKVTAPKKSRPSRVSIPVTVGDPEALSPVAIPPSSEEDEEEEDDDDKTVVSGNKQKTNAATSTTSSLDSATVGTFSKGSPSQ